MSYKVVFLDRASLKAKVRKPKDASEYVEHQKTSVDEIVPRLNGAAVAIVNKVPMREATLAQLPELKMIAVAATGYDVIDIAYCKSHGIAVANIRNYAVHTVPEHAFMLILALRRNLLAYRQDVENGVGNKSDQFCFFTHEIGDLHGSTLGIVGEGAIGQATAAIGRAFGMRVLFADHAPPKMEGVAFTPHEQVLAESDVISLHCPLMPATRNLIDLAAFHKMKRNALLINTARGGLVDEGRVDPGARSGTDRGRRLRCAHSRAPEGWPPVARCSPAELHPDAAHRLGLGRRNAVSRRPADRQHRPLGGGHAAAPRYLNPCTRDGRR